MERNSRTYRSLTSILAAVLLMNIGMPAARYTCMVSGMSVIVSPLARSEVGVVDQVAERGPMITKHDDSSCSCCSSCHDIEHCVLIRGEQTTQAFTSNETRHDVGSQSLNVSQSEVAIETVRPVSSVVYYDDVGSPSYDGVSLHVLHSSFLI